MDQRIVDLYDEYTHAPLERRVFLSRLAELAGGMSAALALVPLLEARDARAAVVPADDERLAVARVTWPGATGEMKGYLAHPKGASRLPAVIVIHENRGLNAHTEDVTRRFALEGFLALAPDFLSPLGGTPENEDTAREMIGKLDEGATVQNAVATVGYLEKHESGNGRAGVVGFCWGGALVGQLSVASADLDAGVSYYGRQPKAEDVPKIKAPLLFHYAGLDARINAGIPALVEAMEKAKVPYDLVVHAGVNHAFNNDTSEARYDRETAERAWAHTVTFLKKHLKSEG
jgi:carboxymethylenebutenolidase